jgi:Zn-finger nucleic acid-binding protein
MQDHSPKRMKGGDDILLTVDTGMRPDSVSVDADHSSRFEQLSIDAAKLPSTTSSASSAGRSNLFLSMSTSPLNNEVEATGKSDKKPATKDDASVNKRVPVPKIDTSAAIAVARPSDTPTPPVHGELGSSLTDEHSMLNQHLRNQTFTPLHHENTGVSPSNAVMASALQQQLSWDIAGDTPSLGDLADWDVDKLSKTAIKEEQKSRPSSTSSSSTRNMMISPHDYHFWKDDTEIPIPESAIASTGGTNTPLPIFFGQAHGEGNENQAKKHSDQDHLHHMYMANSARPVAPGAAGLKLSNKPVPLPVWSKHYDPTGMPPTPVFPPGEYRDDGFGPRSPMGNDRRDMEYYPFPPHMGHIHNDRVRNLRGRIPPGGHMPPMPIHIPPHMSSHLPMTSPMGLGPKAGLWSPHHMPPPLGSPGHMGSPLAQSRRKCVPLKHPVPSKFQGDMDKSKSALVPEFTNLVNFPAYMSQKQSVNLPEGMRCCVMCGQACPCSTANKTKKCKKLGGSEDVGPHSSAHDLGDKNSGYAIIPTQNKGLCTLCDVNVWVVVSSGLEIKWCKGCKNFRPWAAFGDKGLATKCLRCRDRQREKYALQKEEKEKTRSTTAAAAPHHKLKLSINK